MTLPVQSYAWYRVREGVANWVMRVTALTDEQLMVDNQNQPRPDLAYVGITRRDVTTVTGYDEARIEEVDIEIDVTVTAANTGETVALILYGKRYAYTLSGADDTEAARNALLALITEDLLRTVTAADGTPIAIGFQPCTATASGTDVIAFAGIGTTQVPVRLETVEGCASLVTLAEYRYVQKGLQDFVVRLDLYFPERQQAFENIEDYAQELKASLMDEFEAMDLAADGLGVTDPTRVTIQEASATSGGSRQRRKIMDVVFNTAVRRYSIRPGIEDFVDPTIEIATPVSIV